MGQLRLFDALHRLGRAEHLNQFGPAPQMGVEFCDGLRQGLVEEGLRFADGGLHLVVEGEEGQAFLKAMGGRHFNSPRRAESGMISPWIASRG